jgi:hypothetical protein
MWENFTSHVTLNWRRIFFFALAFTFNALNSHFNVIYTSSQTNILIFFLLLLGEIISIEEIVEVYFCKGKWKKYEMKLKSKSWLLFHIFFCEFWAFSSNVSSLLCLTQTFAFFFLLLFVFYSLFSYSQQKLKGQWLPKFYVFALKPSIWVSRSRHIQTTSNEE